MKRRLNSRAAFTLVELLVGATLSAAIMAAVLSSYIYLGRGLARLASQQTLETEARRTLAYFTQDAQAATGFSSTPNASSAALIVPAVNGTNTITYYYNNGPTSTAITINGTSVTMAPYSLTRCVDNGTSVSPVTLLRNISDTNAITSYDLFIRYYDASGNAYDNGSYPYSTATNYTAGIKQMSLQFCTQLGNSSNGTQTQLNWTGSGRVIMRNKGLLP